MKSKWSGLAVMAGGLFLLLGSTPGCVATVRVKPARVVVDEAPPEPKYEAKPAPRSGYVWVRGHWEYRNSRWKWKRGYWKRERTNHVWVHGHWEHRGGRYHWVAGHWKAGSSGPVVRDHREPDPPPPHDTGGGAEVNVDAGVWIETAPPAPKNVPPPAARSGFVWVKGRWEWRNGRWKWRKGRWQKVRTGYVWVAGHWEHKGNRYRWVKGHWQRAGRDDDGGGVRKRDHRGGKERKEERVPAKRGKR